MPLRYDSMPSHCVSFSAILASLFLATRTDPPALRMRPRKSSISATVRPAYCATTTTPELSKIWPSSLTTCSFRALSTVSLQFREGKRPPARFCRGNPGVRSSTRGPNSPAWKHRFRLFHSIPVSGRIYASGLRPSAPTVSDSPANRIRPAAFPTRKSGQRNSVFTWPTECRPIRPAPWRN